MREGKAPRIHCDRGTELHVADPRNPLHVPARLPCIAIEEDVSRNGTAVETPEQIDAESGDRLEEIRTRKARVDPRRPIVIGKVEAESSNSAGIDVVVDI